MCVAQFRDYCKASRFQIDKKYGGDIDMVDDLKNKDIQVKNDCYLEYRTEKGEVYQAVYYRTDLKKMRDLAKQGNPYAVSHLNAL